jgi:hypothetical protein
MGVAREMLSSTRMARAALATLAMVGLAAAGSAQTSARPVAALMVADPALRDAAAALVDADRPIIYYNPAVLQAVGPDLAAFLLAHEEGHLAAGHRRPRDDTLTASEIETLLQGYEREADCYAARRLAREQRGALLTAIAYFQRLGPFRADREHPTGAERAEVIYRCLTGGGTPAGLAGGGPGR